jgi:hypothetical protein
MRVAALPLTSSVREVARNLVALDGVLGFSADGDEEARPWQPSNAAPAQAPPVAIKERRERTKALPHFGQKRRVQITSKNAPSIAALLRNLMFSNASADRSNQCDRGKPYNGAS